MACRLGLDVGGTFTDLMLIHDESGQLFRVKTPSIPGAPYQGELSGVQRILRESGIAPAELDSVMHGTTVATNAVLEGKGDHGAPGKTSLRNSLWSLRGRSWSASSGFEGPPNWVKWSRLFNSTQIVADFDTGNDFYRQKLGFLPYGSHSDLRNPALWHGPSSSRAIA